MIRIVSRIEKNTLIISVYGIIKRDSINIIMDKLWVHLDNGCKFYVIDFRHTKHAHYTLGYRLSDFKRRIDSLGGRLNLVIDSKYIMQILRLSGDDWLYSLSQNQKEAMISILKYRRDNA